MKRSEMQSLVAKMIRLYRLDNVEDMEAADRLLQVLEQEGMLPPEDFSNLDLRQDFLDEHDFTVNKWDKE